MLLGVALPTALSWCQNDMGVRLCDTSAVVLTLLLAAWPVVTCWPFSKFVVFCCCYTSTCLETSRDPRQVCQPGSRVQLLLPASLRACMRHDPWVVDAAKRQLCSGCLAVLMVILVGAKAMFCPAVTLIVAAPCVQRVYSAAMRLFDVCFHCVSRHVVLCVNPAPQQQIIPSFGSVPGLILALVCLLCGLAWGPIVSSFVGLFGGAVLLHFYPFCELLGIRLLVPRCVSVVVVFVALRSVGAANCRENSSGPQCTLQGTLVQGSGSIMAAADFQQRPRVGAAVQQLSRAQTWLYGTVSTWISAASRCRVDASDTECVSGSCLMFWGGKAGVHLVVVGTRVGQVVPNRGV